MKRIALLLAFSALAAPALAQDGEGPYSANSEAKSWSLFGEEKARFEAKVTDALCALTGDCPADCGAGERPMAVIRKDDNKMLLVNKSGAPNFTAANYRLSEFCNQDVEVDGLLVGDPDLTPGIGAKVYQVQLIRAIGSEEWLKTNLYTKQWAERYPEAKGKGPWFKRDPNVKAEIEKNGYFGLGLDADKAWLEENQ